MSPVVQIGLVAVVFIIGLYFAIDGFVRAMALRRSAIKMLDRLEELLGLPVPIDPALTAEKQELSDRAKATIDSMERVRIYSVSRMAICGGVMIFIALITLAVR